MTFSWRRILLLLIIVVILAAAIFVAVTPGTSRNQLIGLGDSYASGEGLPPFITASATGANKCHESTGGAYSVIAAKELGLTGVNQACSGATTDSMLHGTTGEPSQITGFKHAKYITVTIGGNDIDALGAVLSPPTPAQLDSKIATLQTTLEATFKTVNYAAPNATLYVTGYPNIVPTTSPAGCFINQATATSLSGELVKLNQTVQAAAKADGVKYVDFSNIFTGHELCSPQPYVNGIDLANISASLHPNLAGQTQMANTVVTAIKNG